MNRREQADLAWTLTDIAKATLPKDIRVWLYAKIGAGDQELAIFELLRGFVDTRAKLSAEIHAQIAAWVAGYRESDAENELNLLVNQVRVSVKSELAVPQRDVSRRASGPPQATSTGPHHDPNDTMTLSTGLPLCASSGMSPIDWRQNCRLMTEAKARTDVDIT